MLREVGLTEVRKDQLVMDEREKGVKVVRKVGVVMEGKMVKEEGVEKEEEEVVMEVEMVKEGFEE